MLVFGLVRRTSGSCSTCLQLPPQVESSPVGVRKCEHRMGVDYDLRPGKVLFGADCPKIFKGTTLARLKPERTKVDS